MEFVDGYVKGRIIEFGNYAVSVDTTPPSVKPFNFSGIPDMSDMNAILFIIRDDLSGIGSYEGYIDKEWALFEYDQKNNLLTYSFDHGRITRNSKHYLTLKVTDNKDNITLYSCEFYW